MPNNTLDSGKDKIKGFCPLLISLGFGEGYNCIRFVNIPQEHAQRTSL
jgi:hypothetical protein